MERLRSKALQMGVHKSLTNWQDAILNVQEKRRKEVANALASRVKMSAPSDFSCEQGKLNISSHC